MFIVLFMSLTHLIISTGRSSMGPVLIAGADITASYSPVASSIFVAPNNQIGSGLSPSPVTSSASSESSCPRVADGIKQELDGILGEMGMNLPALDESIWAEAAMSVDFPVVDGGGIGHFEGNDSTNGSANSPWCM